MNKLKHLIRIIGRKNPIAVCFIRIVVWLDKCKHFMKSTVVLTDSCVILTYHIRKIDTKVIFTISNEMSKICLTVSFSSKKWDSCRVMFCTAKLPYEHIVHKHAHLMF